ncbi:hypothetical protein HYALB_00013050 [Hymenoscyphus albidus]|uniref:Uncharacterized protein n=1 Tax=Hymenoscyphus albidus TaxID=595503 RepID=A0A9N9LYP9_9HELO|nr:hypothetical protein HYALB_00013050 [Hymenoscyphus albidus]
MQVILSGKVAVPTERHICHAFVANGRRELPLLNTTQSLNSRSFASSTTFNSPKALITPSPAANLTRHRISKNATLEACSSFVSTRQGLGFGLKRGINEGVREEQAVSPSIRNARICEVDGITVQLVYFPTSTASKNVSHPSTLLVPGLNKTLYVSSNFPEHAYQYSNRGLISTSPSVYMLWQSITAHDVYFRTTWQFANVTSTTTIGSEKITCIFSTGAKMRDSSTSRIGPILTNVVHPFDISQLTTYDLAGFGMSSVMDYVQFVGSIRDPTPDPNNPFTYEKMGLTAPSSQLQLAHLYTSCPSTLDKKTPPLTRSNGSAVTEEDEDYLSLLNTRNHQHFRCNPFIRIPAFDWLNVPAWNSCSIKFEHRYFGMPDPPHALIFDSALTPIVPITPPGPVPSPRYPNTSQPAASPVPIGIPGLAPNTSPEAVTKVSVYTGTSTAYSEPKATAQINNAPRPGNLEHYPTGGNVRGGNNAQSNTRPSPGSLDHGSSDDKLNVGFQEPGSISSVGSNTLLAGSENNPTPQGNTPPNLNNPVSDPASYNHGELPNSNSNPNVNKVSPLPENIQHEPLSEPPGGNTPAISHNQPSNPGEPVGPHIPNNQDPKSFPADGPPPINNLPQPGEEPPISAISISLIATEIISTSPRQSHSITQVFNIPFLSPLNPGDITTLPPKSADGVSIIYSMNHDGNLVISSQGAGTATTIPPSNNGVKDDSLVTPLEGADTVVYKGQTLTKSGAVHTLSALSAVVTYGSHGVVIQYPSGIASTIPVSGLETNSPSSTKLANAGDDRCSTSGVAKGSLSLDSPSKSSVQGHILAAEPTTDVTSEKRQVTGRPVAKSTSVSGSMILRGSLSLSVGLGFWGFVVMLC